MRSRVFLGTIAAAAAALLALSGCTGSGAEAGPTPPPTSTAATSLAPTTPAPTPPPTAAPTYQPATQNGPAQNVPVPVMPETANEFSKEGLIAFTEYWYATLGYAFETGDPEPMMSVTGPDCATCSQINKPVGEWYGDGGWIVGGQMTVIQSDSSFSETPEGTYQAILMVRQSKVSYYGADGALLHDYPQDIAEANILIATHDGNRWQTLTAEPMGKTA